MNTQSNEHYIEVIKILGAAGVIMGAIALIGIAFGIVNYLTKDRISKSLGHSGIYFTGIIGYPIHELSHLFFSIISLHEIQEVSLLNSDESDERRGYVNYNYSQTSPYQSIGVFFTSFAPIIIGTLLIGIFTKVYDSSLHDAVTNIDINNLSLQSILTPYNHLINNFEIGNIYSYLYIYLMVSLTTHMNPSKTDFSMSLVGVFWILGVLAVLGLFGIIDSSSITYYYKPLMMIFKHIVFGWSFAVMYYIFINFVSLISKLMYK